MKYMKCVGKHACLCKPKCTSEVHANQRCTHAVCANHDAHGSRLTSRVYTHAPNTHFHVIELSCTRYVVSIFRNMSSRVVASRMLVKFKLSYIVYVLAFCILHLIIRHTKNYTFDTGSCYVCMHVHNYISCYNLTITVSLI